METKCGLLRQQPAECFGGKNVCGSGGLAAAYVEVQASEATGEDAIEARLGNLRRIELCVWGRNIVT